MQDGSFHKNSRGITLQQLRLPILRSRRGTDYFKASETERLAAYLTNKYSLKCTTQKAPKGKGELSNIESLRIYISATSLELV